jgi:hypothetical protein
MSNLFRFEPFSRKADGAREAGIGDARLQQVVLTSTRDFSTLGVVWKPGSGQEAFLPELSSPFSDLHCEGPTHRGQTDKRK